MEVFSYWVPRVIIDLISRLKGIDFEAAYTTSKTINDDGLFIRFIHLNDLIIAKKAYGRFKDLDDIEKLKSIE